MSRATSCPLWTKRGDLGEHGRAGPGRAGARAERIRTTPETPNAIRHPYGPGWALVGDAGLVLDPNTGQGIGHAFRDGELLADGLGGRRPLDQGLVGYAAARDADTLPMFQFTTDLATLRPPTIEDRVLFAALASKPAGVDRFLGVMTGAVPLPEYLSPRNLFKVIGLRGMATVASVRSWSMVSPVSRQRYLAIRVR